MPPDLKLGAETFVFKTSARDGGVFRFRWTLGPGKKGPPEHVHDDENETFAIVSGTLRIWIDGTPRDYAPGETVTVTRGVRHRFLNPGTEAVVVDVSLDGSRMEDTLVPLAVRWGGRDKLKLGDFATMVVHDTTIRGSRPPGKIADAMFSGLGRVIRLFGVKPLAPIERW